MPRKTVCGTTLTLLLMGALALAVNIQPVNAEPEVTVTPEFPTTLDDVHLTVSFTFYWSLPCVRDFGPLTRSLSVFSVNVTILVAYPTLFLIPVVHTDEFTYQLGRLSADSYVFKVYVEVIEVNIEDGNLTYRFVDYRLSKRLSFNVCQAFALNLQSIGSRIPVCIEPPEGYSTSNINVSTITLNDTIPLGSESPVIIDSNGNGIPELLVIFNRTEVAKYILSKGITHGDAPLVASGKFYDDTLLEVNVIIRVSEQIGDVNCDGKVDIYDVVLACASYCSREEEPNWNSNANFAPMWDIINIYDVVTIVSCYGEKCP